jgi:hypothetical protein
MEIQYEGKRGLFEMSSDYTAFPDEAEVLIQDGFKYTITDVDKTKVAEVEGKKVPYVQITLVYPPVVEDEEFENDDY